MKLTAQLAYSQLAVTRNRTIWTLIGIMLSTAMITAVSGFVASGIEAFSGLQNKIFYSITLIFMAMALEILVITFSVIVVSNAFRVSASERTVQFGILKSVGATKKQIIETVLYEGILLCCAGIPLGIVFGLLVEFVGLKIASMYLTGFGELLFTDSGVVLAVDFVVSWQAIVLSALVAFITVLISAWIPARKAAKITAIDAIRGAGDIKIKARQLRTSPFIQRWFGFEGELAVKSLKRSKRNYRTAVVSLAASIVLFIIVNSFGTMMTETTVLLNAGANAGADVVVKLSSRANDAFINNSYGEQITEKMRDFPDTNVFGLGSNNLVYQSFIKLDSVTPEMRDSLNRFGYAPDSSGYTLPVRLIVTDTIHYNLLCQQAGVPLGSNLLINHNSYYVGIGDGTELELHEYAPFVWNFQALTLVDDHNSAIQLPLHGELKQEQVPDEMMYDVETTDINILVPKLDAINYLWFVNPQHTEGFMQYAGSIVNELDLWSRENGMFLEIIDAKRTNETLRNLADLILMFTYGFIGMLTLIGLTNVISTISVNVRSRAQEFAILQSAGMSYDGLKRMLNLESLLCSLKSLLIGLPLGVVFSFLIYKAVLVSVQFEYTFPWFSIILCTLFVFAITWGTMRYSVAQLKSKNLIETIRSANGSV